MVSKVFEKLVNNRIVDHLEKCDFQYGFRSSRSTADLLTVVSDTVATAFNVVITQISIKLHFVNSLKYEDSLILSGDNVFFIIFEKNF